METIARDIVEEMDKRLSLKLVFYNMLFGSQAVDYRIALTYIWIFMWGIYGEYFL